MVGVARESSPTETNSGKDPEFDDDLLLNCEQKDR